MDEVSPTASILYIEDDPEMIELVSMILTRQGYQVSGANGGRKGLELAQGDRPDLILLDLMMPDMDGWDVYQQLKSSELTHNIPVIVITAKSQTIDQVLWIQIAKVDAYIIKPFRPDELIESVKNVLAAINSR
jgi:two-component system response regulator VicR